MDAYRVVVYVHAASILLFFVAHGVSMSVAFALRRERHPDRVRALLDLSGWVMGAPAIATVSIGVLTGIAAGVMGEWWTAAWFWVSLALFIVAAAAMTPMAANRLHAMREAAGMRRGHRRPSAAEVPGPGDPQELARLLEAWNPVPIAALGLGAFLVILWLMLFKPF